MTESRFRQQTWKTVYQTEQKLCIHSDNTNGKRLNKQLRAKISHTQCIKIAVLTTRSLVPMSECQNDKQFSKETGFVIICQAKTPRGPRVQSLVTRVKDAVHTLCFLGGYTLSPFLVLRLLTISVTGVACGGDYFQPFSLNFRTRTLRPDFSSLEAFYFHGNTSNTVAIHHIKIIQHF